MATKHLLKFKTEADYKTAKRNHLVLPNVSSIEESGNTYINGRFTTKEKAEAGTIIAHHLHSTGEYEVKYIVPEAYEPGDPYWTAEAVVVVPYGHTGDGTVRAMALDYANITTPDGDTSFIMWGANVNIEGINNYSGGIKFANYNDQTSSSFGTSKTVYLPSDSFSGDKDKVNPYDSETGYKANIDPHYAPSPYNENGSKNDAYHSLGTFASVTDNYLKDMDGKGNTLKILRSLNQDYLSQTLYAHSLDNAQTKTYESITLNLFPAACACAKYNEILKHCNIDINKTLEENIADNAMPWYLPSCGELGYIMVRLARIQYALKQANGVALEEQILLSSTEYTSNSSNLVIGLHPSTGIVYSRFKNEPKGMVRPFAAY